MKAPAINHKGKVLTFYEFFEVDEKVTPEDLKVAYRKICLKHHPDKNENKKQAEENFKTVQLVWAILSNPSKRANYDQKLAIERGQLEPVMQGFSIHFSWFNSSGMQNTSTTTGYSAW